MGDSWIDESNNVERIFQFSEKFKEICPFYMSIGMSYKEFWQDDVCVAKYYLEAYKLKEKRKIERDEWYMWKQGMYIYEALCDVSPVLHAFSKKRNKASTIF